MHPSDPEGPTPPEPEAERAAAPDPAPPPAPGPAAPFRKSGLLFFAAMMLLFGPGLVAQQLHPPLGLAWSEVFIFLLAPFVAAAGSNLRPVPYLGLSRPAARPVVYGALVGAAGFLVANGVMALWIRVVPRGWVEAFDVGRLFDTPLPTRIALALVASVLAPLCEETAFRGYLQRTFAIRHGPVRAIAAASFLFALLHLDPVRFPALLLLGAIFGWLAWRSGSTWPAIAAHGANNGLASALLLALGAPEAPPQDPPVGAVLRTLAIGLFALVLLLRAFAASTPAAPAPAAAIVLADPADPSTRFRPGRVPPALRAAAWTGAALLALLAAAAPWLGSPPR